MIRAVLGSRWTRVGLGLLIVSSTHLWFLGRRDITPTIDVVELEWSVTALIGVIYSADFVRDKVQDWRAQVDSQTNGGARLVLEILLLIGSLLTGLHLVLLSLGALSMLTPTNPRPTNPLLATITGVVYVAAGQGLVLVLVIIRSKTAQLRRLGLVTASDPTPPAASA